MDEKVYTQATVQSYCCASFVKLRTLFALLHKLNGQYVPLFYHQLYLTFE